MYNTAALKETLAPIKSLMNKAEQLNDALENGTITQVEFNTEARNILLMHKYSSCCECEKLTLSTLECIRCNGVICNDCADSLHEDRTGHVWCSICIGG